MRSSRPPRASLRDGRGRARASRAPGNEKVVLNLTRDDLVQAMARFDAGERSPQWATRGAGLGITYAVQYQGRRYPFRELARLALYARDGNWEQESLGSAALRAHLQNLGFTVIRIVRPRPGRQPGGWRGRGTTN